MNTRNSDGPAYWIDTSPKLITKYQESDFRRKKSRDRNQRHERVVKAVKSDPSITTKALARKYLVAEGTIKRDIKFLKEQGQIDVNYEPKT